jgi:hypothetical protein
MFEDIPSSGYPVEFSYQLSKLQGALSKQVIKVSADRSSGLAPHQIINYRLPIGALLNLDSLALWFKVDMKSEKVLPARYASSFIKRLSIQMNNVSVQIVQDYNFVYSFYHDHNNKALTKGHAGDWTDNSILWSQAAPTNATETAITGVNSLANGNAIQTGIKLCVNNFIGFLSSASTRILPTDRTGEVVISLELAPTWEVLGGAENITPTAAATYEITETYLTCEALSFSDDSYYNALNSKDDLKFGFSDYVVSTFASTTKKTGINVTTYLSAGSIDHIVGTCRNPPKSIPEKMVAYGTLGTSGTALNIYKYLSDPVAYAGNDSATPADNVEGDGFYSTKGLQRQMANISSSQFSINNKALNYGSFDPKEIFFNNLCALGYENVDVSANGLSPAIVSLFHYFKYYGGCIQSLELIDKNSFFISGLSSSGSSCAVNWVAKFDGATNEVPVIPVLICKLSRVLHVKQGRMISIE